MVPAMPADAKRLSSLLTLLLAVALGIAIASPAHAQESGAAAIEGTVYDPDGKAVVGVAIAIRNTATGYSRTMTTDQSGHFRATAVPVGVYAVEARNAGFATCTRMASRCRLAKPPR